MKYTLKTAVFGRIYQAVCRKGLKSAITARAAEDHIDPRKAGAGNPQTGRTILSEYREIWRRAGEVGDKNKLYSAYAMAAYFIAAVRITCLPPETVYHALENGCRKSRLFAKLMEPAEKYLSESRLPGRFAWAEETHDPKHRAACPNDWVVEIVTPAAQSDVQQGAAGTPVFELGYDYYECGVCKLCREEACPELARYMCRLDYLMADMMGMTLTRTKTLAEGGDYCDFRYSRR